ncbi:FMN-dependent NADH-azoreductase [Spiribacter halobius]|uniref:FMN dependent NADH:quinone oxidoreductase n=1 Tax=Sediminicurvatus halobius TaxID=2182432 RepID=A0A2U2N372_9GAMM|nr:NAD(P)H-dependent oxidoreductase [Spiribacter halobius]PWG63543.1 FMN-dependent NADH-azoreductase [Spiribacter halobius]UEX79577.1 NAD(P)H-dependent oxidoreductase [Spiribacter halobius]
MSNGETTVLRVDGSGRYAGSYSRHLVDAVLDHWRGRVSALRVLRHELAGGVPQVDERWIAANFTPADERSPAQRAALTTSDEMVDDLFAADAVVIGAPIYNFGIPAALKAWVDLVCRARRTFRYTESGPRGLLEGRQACVVMVSGGTAVGSDLDHASGYLRHVLGFIGIQDVEWVVADGLMSAADERLAAARARVASLPVPGRVPH